MLGRESGGRDDREYGDWIEIRNSECGGEACKARRASVRGYLGVQWGEGEETGTRR